MTTFKEREKALEYVNDLIGVYTAQMVSDAARRDLIRAARNIIGWHDIIRDLDNSISACEATVERLQHVRRVLLPPARKRARRRPTS